MYTEAGSEKEGKKELDNESYEKHNEWNTTEKQIPYHTRVSTTTDPLKLEEKIQKEEKMSEFSSSTKYFTQTKNAPNKKARRKKYCCFRGKPKVLVEEENRFRHLNGAAKSDAINNLWKWAIKKIIWKNKMGLFMGNLLKETQGETDKKDWCLVVPGSSFKFIWDMVMLVLLLYMASFTPFLVSFMDRIPSIYSLIENIVNGVFFVDIFICFSTAYYSHTHLVKDRKTIALHYLSTWFIIDLISCLPLHIFAGEDEEYVENPFLSTRVFRLLTLLKLMKLGRLMRFIQLFIDKVFNIHRNLESSRALNALISLIFFVHLFACGWFLVARFNNFTEDTWVVRMGIRDSIVWDKYLVAIYWVFQTLTTVGYGDIGAVTNYERIFSLILMSFGVAFYSSLFQPMDEATRKLRGQMMALAIFAKKHKLPNEVTAKVRNHIELFTDDYFDRLEKQGLIDDLPGHLRNEVILNTHGKFLSKIKIFKGKPLDVLWKIGNKLRHRKYLPGEVIYSVDDMSLAVYFVRKGFVNISKDSGNTINRFAANSMFGAVEVIDNRPRMVSAIASKDESVELDFILREDLMTILKNHPSIIEEMTKLVQLRRSYTLQPGEKFIELEGMIKLNDSSYQSSFSSIFDGEAPKQTHKKKRTKKHNKRKSVTKYQVWKNCQSIDTRSQLLKELKSTPGEHQELITEMKSIDHAISELQNIMEYDRSVIEPGGHGGGKELDRKLESIKSSLMDVLLYFQFMDKI